MTAEPEGRVVDTPFGLLRQRRWHWQSEALSALPLGGARVTISIKVPEPEGELDYRLVDAATRFLGQPATVREEVVPHLWALYVGVRDDVDPPPPMVDGPGAIWDHVRPHSVRAERGFADRMPYLSVDASCTWDDEHGVQLVWQDGGEARRGRWVRAAENSGHLTDGDSWGRPALDAWMADPEARLPVRTQEEMLAVPEARS